MPGLTALAWFYAKSQSGGIMSRSIIFRLNYIKLNTKYNLYAQYLSYLQSLHHSKLTFNAGAKGFWPENQFKILIKIRI